MTKINDDEGQVEAQVAALEAMFKMFVKVGLIKTDDQGESLTPAGEAAMMVLGGILIAESEESFDDYVEMVRNGYREALAEYERHRTT